MSLNMGFIDLRSTSREGGSHTDESVWPSFTDIMAVVVMIFLMSLVVILLRNVELIKAERESAQIAEMSSSQRDELEIQVKNLEQRIAKIQINLESQLLLNARTAEELKSTKAKLSQDEERITGLMANIQALQVLKQQLESQVTSLISEKLTLQIDKDQLQDSLSISTEKLAALEILNQQSRLQIEELETQAKSKQDDFDALTVIYNLLEKDKRSLTERISQAQKMIEALETNISGLEQTIKDKDENIVIKTQELAQTKEEFSALEAKYFKLVGPARSELDKTVVRVRLSLRKGKKVYEFAKSSSAAYKKISLKQLHSTLAKLKKSTDNKLYTKIIIAPKSGLSYDEVWQFTNDILGKYDYYSK